MIDILHTLVGKTGADVVDRIKDAWIRPCLLEQCETASAAMTEFQGALVNIESTSDPALNGYAQNYWPP